MNYFDPPDKTQSVLSQLPRREFIGKVRHRLFVDHDCEWNGVVREITAQLERDEMVNADIVCVHLAEHYRIKAYWARFQAALAERPQQEGK
jgi:hypothetical protein